MKSRFTPTAARRANERGFTLVEILAAVSVLTLVLALVAQLTTSAAAVITSNGKHLDANNEACLIFNRMADDFSRMLKRPDVDYTSFKQPGNLLNGNDQMAFYSETSGYFSSIPAPVGAARSDASLVAYMIANDPYSATPALQRMGKGLGWEPESSVSPPLANVVYLPITLTANWPNLFTAAPLDPDYKSIGSQVFRIEYTYLLKSTATQPARLSITPWDTTAVPAHASVNGFTDVAAIVVAIAILDNSSRLVVNNYASLSQALPDATDGTDIASSWNTQVNSPTFASTANIPKSAAAAVRIYQRYFYLNSPQ